MSEWQQALEASLGAGVTRLDALGGGDFAKAYQAVLSDERVLFVKTHAAPPEGFFSTEAAGLSWLRDAGTARIPEVLFVSDDPPCLALEWIEPGRGARGGSEGGARGGIEDEEQLGRALADLHASGAPAFGRSDHRTTGSLAVPNEPAEDWPSFYAERRLLPLARLAHERQALPERDIQRLESVAARLDTFGAADEPAARLHGDLWAGNRIVDASGQSWLIDPAAHGGHREFDLAMMRLFGGFSEHCHAAYREHTPLTAEWQARIPLHQLAPLVVHAIKFGGGYARSVRAALDACR